MTTSYILNMHIIGLSISITHDGNHLLPTPCDENGTPYFGTERWQGWADLLNARPDATLHIVGGMERLHAHTIPDALKRSFDHHCGALPRGELTKHILQTRYRVAPTQINFLISEGNTGGNIAAIKSYLEHTTTTPIISSNAYHLPRAMMDMADASIFLPSIPAEAFSLAYGDKDAVKKNFQNSFGPGAGARMVEELCGCADKLTNTYTPRSR